MSSVDVKVKFGVTLIEALGVQAVGFHSLALVAPHRGIIALVTDISTLILVTDISTLITDLPSNREGD